MKTYYTCDTAFKMVTLDNWKDGCTSNSSHIGIDAVFKATNINEMLSSIANFCNSNISDATIDACGETGRVDFQVYENEQGERASDSEIASYKKGEIDLYLCDYTFHIEEVISRPAFIPY